MNVLERIGGVILGFVIGSVAIVVLRLAFDWGLSLLPLRDLFLDLAPGMIGGAILGALFPKVFFRMIVLLPFDW